MSRNFYSPTRCCTALHCTALHFPRGPPTIKYASAPPDAVNAYDPLAVIAAHNASCTGISVLFACACRAAGIPARIAGVPHWNSGPAECPHGDADDACGNHDWNEVWLGGGAGKGQKGGEGWAFMDTTASHSRFNTSWFYPGKISQQVHPTLPDTALNSSGGNHSVWASSFGLTPGVRFPMVWDWGWNAGAGGLPGVDVTERYIHPSPVPGAPTPPPTPDPRCPPSGCGNCGGAPQAFCVAHCFNGCQYCCAPYAAASPALSLSTAVAAVAPPAAAAAAAVPATAPAAMVQVEQFGMCQCPMTTTWFSAFYDACLKHRPAMLALVNFTQFYVGGKHGGHVDAATWNSSFHGYGEVMGDRFQLCAKEQLGGAGGAAAWLAFEACQNGIGGAAGIGDIPQNSEKCAAKAALDWPLLRACATGDAGLALFRRSVFYTSDHNITYDTLVPGSGKLENIPVVHIGGEALTGLDAYKNLSARICQHAAAAADCGCDEALLRQRAEAAQAL